MGVGPDGGHEGRARQEWEPDVGEDQTGVMPDRAGARQVQRPDGNKNQMGYWGRQEQEPDRAGDPITQYGTRPLTGNPSPIWYLTSMWYPT